ncbi:MAG: PadR family transcriptional regulator [Bacteroidota bacterium]
MKGTYLGEFEELILLTVAANEQDAYAVIVKKEAEAIAQRKINISAVHSSLYRLERKGFLSSTLGGSTPKRGGKQKRIFTVTNAGFEALKASKAIKERLWKKIPRLSIVDV